MEFIDKVDDKNNIIGKTSKNESHELGFPHRIAVVYIFNYNGDLLINKRFDNSLLDHSVGGHIQKGEDPYIAAQREASEEVGLKDGRNFDYIGTFYLPEVSRGNKIFHWIYFYKTVVNYFEPVIQKEEVINVEWYSLEKLKDMMLKDPDKFSLGFIGTMNYYYKNVLGEESKIPLI